MTEHPERKIDTQTSPQPGRNVNSGKGSETAMEAMIRKRRLSLTQLLAEEQQPGAEGHVQQRNAQDEA